MMRCGGRNEAGLLAVLWSAQGELPLDHVPGGVLEELRAALGAQMSGRSGAAFEKQLRKAFEAGWQPARMQPKKGLLHEIEEHLAKAEAAAEANRSILEEADERGRKARECRDLAATLRAEIANLVVKRQTAEAVAREFGELRDQAENFEREHKSSAALYGAFWHRVEQIRTESTRRDQLCAAVPELVAALERQRAEEATAKAIAGAAAQASIEAAQPDATIEQTEARALLAESWAELARDSEAVERKLGKLAQLAQAAAKIHQELSHPAGSRSADTRQNPRRPRANSRCASPFGEAGTSARNLGDQRIEPGCSARSRCLAIPRGASYSVHGNDGISVSFPGFAGLRISGPQTDAAKWNAQAAAADGELAQLCETFGSSEVVTLAARAEQRAELERELKGLDANRTELLGGESLESLSTALENVSQQRARMESAQPEWRANPPEVPLLRTEVARLRSAREERLRQRQEEASREGSRYAERQAGRERAGAALTLNRAQLEDAERRVRELEGDGKTADQRGQELHNTARYRDDVEQKLREARVRLATLPQDAPQTVAAISARQKGAELRLSQAEREAVDAEATQRTLLSRGPYAGLAQSEEDIEHHMRDRAREVLRLNSIRRLWEVFEAQKARAFEGIAEPVSQRASEILAEIMGRRHADLTLSSDFSNTTIRPVAAGREADIQQMSGGEREQIALSVRLALAEHLTTAERHLVVLDDVLLNTDEPTLGRILNFLEQKKERFQVAILTCHAERYRGLRGVRKIAFPPATAKTSEAE